MSVELIEERTTPASFLLSDMDRRLLAFIARNRGNASMSAVLRQMIRDEAVKLNLELQESQPELPQPA